MVHVTYASSCSVPTLLLYVLYACFLHWTCHVDNVRRLRRAAATVRRTLRTLSTITLFLFLQLFAAALAAVQRNRLVAARSFVALFAGRSFFFLFMLLLLLLLPCYIKTNYTLCFCCRLY